MNKIMKLFCRHHGYNQIICWHWTHGYAMNEPAFIEIQVRCLHCDKLYFRYIRNREECNSFAENYSDLRWSESCKPLLNIKYYKEKTNVWR